MFFGRGWHRLDSEPARPAAFATMTALVLFIAMYFAARVGAIVGLKFAGVSLDESGTLPELSIRQIAIVQTGVYAAQSIVAGAYLWMRMRAAALAEEQRLSRARAATIGGLALLIAWPTALSIAALVSHFSGDQPEPIAHELLKKMTEDRAGLWLAVVSSQAIVGAPILEEIMYRGILQRGFVDTGVNRWVAIGITSAVFAAMHWETVEPHAIVALFVLSLGFGYVYEKTGRLTGPIVMHMIFNAGNLAMAFAVNGS